MSSKKRQTVYEQLFEEKNLSALRIYCDQLYRDYALVQEERDKLLTDLEHAEAVLDCIRYVDRVHAEDEVNRRMSSTTTEGK